MNEDDDIPELVDLDSVFLIPKAIHIADADPSERVIPITILTGFLGAGKTTLLSHILTANHKKRIAVIENELSLGLGIEQLIAKSGVSGSNIDGFFELNNGCICCSVKDNLLATLEQLAKHPDRFDYIIIEMTGVANPGPVISSFWLDDGLHSVLKLDGIVCVVDGLHIEQYLQSEDISYDVTRQICYADRILINKCDLIQPEQAMAINVIVRSLNGLAEIRHTSLSSKVSLDFVLDINGYATNIENILSRGVFDDLASPAKDSMCHPCKPVTSHMALTLSTQSISFTGVLSLRELEIYLNKILYECSNNDVPKTHSPAINKDSDDMKIFRMKGVVHIDGDQHLHILQGVHDTYEIKPSRIVAGSPEDTSRNNNLITIIGKRIDAEALRHGFIRCKETG